MAIDLSAPETNRPYPPPSNVIAVLNRLRSRNLSERIDADYLRDAGVPEGTIHRVSFALRFLGLVENDAPTKALRSITTSTDEEYRDILAGLIRDAYRELFEIVDPAQDSADRIVNVFRRYTPASQRERMVNFFLGMCREAGIPTLDAPRQRTSGVSTGAGRPRPRSASSAAPKADASAGPARAGDGADRGGVALPPALELLVRSLPPEGAAMSAGRRDQWVQMAKATLAFVYPEEEDVASDPVDRAGSAPVSREEGG